MSLELFRYYRLRCDCQLDGCHDFHDLGYLSEAKELSRLYREAGWAILRGGLWGVWACPACKEKQQ